MSILYLLIPLAVGLMIVAIAFFLWTVRTGQYDDLEGPAHRILMDDDDPMIPHNTRPKRPPPASAKPETATRPDATKGDGAIDDNAAD
jgi:cbb3-type cytochrome oxidase maturation protein